MTSSTSPTLVPNPNGCVPFGDIRRDALEHWTKLLVGAGDEPMHCAWQTSSAALPHNCATASCADRHVSLYCSFDEDVCQIDDLMTDERFDYIPFGLDADGSILPTDDGDAPAPALLFRFYNRVLLATYTIIDDLGEFLELADPTLNDRGRRKAMSTGVPLELQPLLSFINNCGKHGASRPESLHRWNHHAPIYFEDAGISPTGPAGKTTFTAHRTIDKTATYDAILMPKLRDVVKTLATAIGNVDGRVKQPAVLQRLAAAYGTCMPG